MSTGHVRTVAAVLLAVIAAGACGVPDDREPRVISAADAPLDLDPTDDEGPAAGAAEVRLYFVDDGQLVSVGRAADDETLDIALGALLAGPQESDPGQLTTIIPPETVLRSATIEDEVAVINLGCGDQAPVGVCGILGIEGPPQAILFGQLVCTADAVPGVAGVLFQHEGEQQPAPIADLSNSDQPVRCLDYRSLWPGADDGRGGNGDDEPVDDTAPDT